MNDRLATQLQRDGVCRVDDLPLSEIVELVETLGIDPALVRVSAADPVGVDLYVLEDGRET